MNEFDLIAKNFDTNTRVERSKIIAAEIRSRINNGEQKTALEFGCGTGLVGLQLLEEFASILFVDSSDAMIEQLKQKLASLEQPSSSAICCDIIADTSIDLHVDYIFTSLVLHHIIDTEAVLSRLYSILNDGGCLIIVDLDEDDGSFHKNCTHSKMHNGFSQSKLSELVKKSGFAEVEAKSFYYDNKTVDEKKVPYSLFILEAKK